jgi:hypothetical protein
MQQFMAGWQMGQGRNENMRRDQELAMEQQRQQEMLQQRAQEFEMRKEEFAVRKKQLAAEEAAAKLDAAKQAYELRSQASSLQGFPAPTAREVGIQQTTPQDVGPTLDQINVPQPTMDIPNPMEGQAPIAMPVLTGAQQLAERQRKNREALGLLRDEEKTKLEVREPFQIRDDERTAKLYSQRDAAAESRAEARYKRQAGSVNKQADGLRKEYNNQIKPYLPQLDNFNKASALAAKPDDARTAADDMALVFIFMRSLDPGSTVREGEYATAKNTAGVPDRVRNAYNAALNGQFLSPTQRKDFAGAIERDFTAGPGKAISTIQNRYRYLGQQAGIENPDQMILMDIGGESAAPAGGDYEPTSVPGVRRRKVQR